VTEIAAWLGQDVPHRVAAGPAGLAAPPANGQIAGTLKIANPDKFWLTSRFLILIQG
jgi:hypothetical protein